MDLSDNGEAAKDSSNPFGNDVDFSEIQRRRDRAKAAKESAKEPAAQSILAGMDAVDPENTQNSHSMRAPKSPRHKPNIIHHRAKSSGDAPANAPVASRGFFSAFRSGLDVPQEDTNADDDNDAELGPFLIGNRCVAVWPFDDYHVVQKLYYEKLLEFDHSSPRHNNNNNELSKNKDNAIVDQQSSIPIFSRPADPPDIPTAVQGLSLTDFEAKAEERAIAIVSTWLFDAGLIDELLVNGGMTGQHQLTNTDSTNTSVQTSEGIEVGLHGAPIEGSTKMDKEIAKLRSSTKRQLTLINARLNDGVAATGSEVQELVNAVIATKDDIGRLRELSTYVSNPNDVEQTSQFMLTKYPKLKQAINARRNLARCFRELDFFSQIPTTCDRLREELHAGEWTAHEWSTIRSVCREHVELEIFLVEAEAGMKNRMEDEVEDPNTRRLVRRKSNQFGRHAFKESGLSNNDELIDRFLEEHVENVWELGDEIRMRIMVRNNRTHISIQSSYIVFFFVWRTYIPFSSPPFSPELRPRSI
jgi:hypothetical protein